MNEVTSLHTAAWDDHIIFEEKSESAVAWDTRISLGCYFWAIM